MNDNQLISKVLDGDEEAFAEIVKIYLKPIYNFLYRLAGDRDAAEDLTQETFVKAWRNLKSFDQKRSFKTWLFTIAKNTAFRLAEKEKRNPIFEFRGRRRGKLAGKCRR